MEIADEVRGRIVVIREVDQDRDRVTVEYRNGETGWFTPPESSDFEVGTVWLIGDGSILPADEELWPHRTRYVVVAQVLDDTLIVEDHGRLRALRTEDPRRFTRGQTIEVDNLDAVVRIVAQRPLRPYGVGEQDEYSVASFRRTTGDSGGFAGFGGYEKVVERARELIETPLRWRGALEKIGARPVKGVLFSGPPGTGKTKLASLIANASSATFYEVPGPAIVSKYVGDSEKALRDLFDEARGRSAAIIFFDEIDSIAGRRDGDSHEASRRLVAQLLTALDGFTSATNVVVIGATNRIWDIDPALRRPGRFDWVVDFPMPSRDDRQAILKVSAEALTTAGPLPYAEVADLTEGWSPADLTAILTEAALLAVRDGGRSIILAEDYWGGFARLAERRRLSASIDARAV